VALLRGGGRRSTAPSSIGEQESGFGKIGGEAKKKLPTFLLRRRGIRKRASSDVKREKGFQPPPAISLRVRERDSAGSRYKYWEEKRTLPVRTQDQSETMKGEET